MLNRSIKNLVLSLIFLCMLALSLFSCTKNKTEIKNVTETINPLNTTITEDGSVIASIGTKGDSKLFEYNILDLEETYDDVAALTIDFDKGVFPESSEELIRDDGENVIIKSGGIYRLTGTLNNKRIWVEKGIGERVQLVLDGLKINTDKYSAIRVVDDVIAQIFLASGSENEINLSVEGNPKQDAITPTGIFSRNDLTFNGKGKLTINCNVNSASAIESDDKVIFIRGDYNFDSKGDSIKAKNEVIFREGNFAINAGDDAIKVKNDNGGRVYLENANLNIKSGDKGIVSDDQVLILGGNAYIDSIGESIGGKTIDIYGGNISLKSGDDAINSTDGKQDKKSNQLGVYTRIAGGTLDIDAGMDGIDSNGDLYLEGGHIFINGANNDNERIIDYNGTVSCGKGLTFCGVGPASKMQDLGDNAMENYLVIYFKEQMKANDMIRVIDEDENQVLVFSPIKNYMAALIALEDLKTGKTYKITAGDKEFKQTIVEGRNEIRE